MDPAPLCKTAILRFIIDETLTKFWNVSSISRKRTQMVVEEKHVVVNEYNEKALKINGWVKIGKNGKPVEEIEEIKKGVSNYYLRTQEEAERVISLNGKLRCYALEFELEIPLEIDYIQETRIDENNYDYYLKCSLNKALNLACNKLSSAQMKKIINKFKKVYSLYINYSSVSNLDLNSSKTSKISYYHTTFIEQIDLPSNLKDLTIDMCTNVHFLNIKRVTEIKFLQNDSFDFIKKCKGLKIVDAYFPFSKLVNYLPSTVRQLGPNVTIKENNIDLASLKQKLPFLIRILDEVSVEIAQAFNLRTVNPIINATKKIFTYRPRQIMFNDDNVEQLNKHSELFEKVEKVRIYSGKFNFGCLNDKIRKIEFYYFPIEKEKLESLEKNKWKFEKTNISIYCPENQARVILNSLVKVKKIKLSKSLKNLTKDYSQFEFTFK